MDGYQTFDSVLEEYLRSHPDEVGSYLNGAFEDFGEHGNVAALMVSLRVIAKVKGVSALAGQTGLSRQGVQKALSAKGNPRFDSIHAIIKALGYQLALKPLAGTP